MIDEHNRTKRSGTGIKKGCEQNSRNYNEEAGRRLPDKKTDGYAQCNQRGHKKISRRALGSGANLAGFNAFASLFRIGSLQPSNPNSAYAIDDTGIVQRC
jgi:hypothetical protein